MRILITGGGTAGHINPGLSIAKFIRAKRPDCEIVFAGTSRGLESRLVPREGFRLLLIDARGFKRKLSLDVFVTLKDNIKGFIKAYRELKKYGPDAVIGTGGYVCGPVIMCAFLMGIPTIIHEQNVLPGLTNRILGRFVTRIAISYPESQKLFKNHEKIVLTGNPVRMGLLDTDKPTARKKLGIPEESKVVVIFGGSRGALNINRSVVTMLREYYRRGDFKLFFATGEDQYDDVIEMLDGWSDPDVNVIPYIYNADIVYPAADLVVSRAGAITCSELTALGLPSIMIPSPYVTANHQEYNARILEKHGAAQVILEKDLNGNLLFKNIKSLFFDSARLSDMSMNSKNLGVIDAPEKIYALIEGLIAGKPSN